MPNKLRPVLFLDRDGTINVDMGSGYLNTVEDTKLIPGVGRAIVRGQSAGFKIAIVTNQAGVAKGITPRENLPKIHQHLEQLIAVEAQVQSFSFDHVQICMHKPDDLCKCRKPETDMVRWGIEALSADVSCSFFIGDKLTDIICGNRMGLRTILVMTGHGSAEVSQVGKTSVYAEFATPTHSVTSLSEAIDIAIGLIQ